MNTMLLKTSDRDGGEFRTFRVMTLEEAKALKPGQHVWRRMTDIAQQFKLYDAKTWAAAKLSKTFVVKPEWRLATDLGISADIEKEVRAGVLLVEVPSEDALTLQRLNPFPGVLVLQSTESRVKSKQWWIQNPPIAVEDITKLVVDQNVFIFSGIYYVTGKVTKVSPGSVEVFVLASNKVFGTNQVWRFDSQGETSDGGGGTAEYGPWVIDAMPFEARRAELAKAVRTCD